MSFGELDVIPLCSIAKMAVYVGVFDICLVCLPKSLFHGVYGAYYVIVINEKFVGSLYFLR